MAQSSQPDIEEDDAAIMDAIPVAQDVAPDPALAQRLRRNLLNLVVFAVYASLVWFLALRHEPWFDEAQAWLIARDCGVVDLLSRITHYEGSPGLWHLLLMIPAKLGLPYISLNVTAVLFACAGVAVFLWRAPLPTILRLLAPFSFFLFFQYAVVARTYVVLPLLLFLIATVYPERHRRRWLYILLLAVMANFNVHGCLIGMGLVAADVWALFNNWRVAGAAIRRSVLSMTGVFGVVVLLVAMQVYQLADGSAVRGVRLDPVEVTWEAFKVLSAAFTESSVVTLAVLGISVYWFWKRGILALYLLPTGMLLLFFGVKYSQVWHQGTLFLVWLLCLWIGYQQRAPLAGKPDGPMAARWLSRVRHPLMTATAALVLAIHVVWSVCVAVHATGAPYCGSKAMAQVLQQRDLANSTLFASDWPCLAVQPYFQRNIFTNYTAAAGGAFNLWSTRNTMMGRPIGQVLSEQPDLLLVSIKFPKDEQTYDELMQAVRGGQVPYRLVCRKDGWLFWKTGVEEMNSLALFERTTPASPRPAAANAH